MTPPEPAPVAIREYLHQVVTRGGSDLHLRAGSPPLIRIDGELEPLPLAPLDPARCEALVDACLPSARERTTFAEHRDCDFALDLPGIGRFRGSAYRSRGTAAVVLRHVREQIPALSDLGLPSVLADWSRLQAGLVLVCGPTGSGKTTTLASLVDLINRQRRCHILTIEDPIEFLHADRVATVSQREILTDTDDFATALRAGLRQDPDVILVGEIRDLTTLRIALQAAETGHLVLASLHAKSAVDAVNRMIDVFPAGEQQQARISLAESLQAIAVQRLAPALRGGRLPAVEVLVSNGRVRDAITDATKTIDLATIIAEGGYYGMRTLEQDLVRLVLERRIEVAEAGALLASPADLHVALRRAGFTASVVA